MANPVHSYFLMYSGMDAFARRGIMSSFLPWLIPDVSHAKHDPEQQREATPAAAPHPPQHESQLPRHVLRVLDQEALHVGEAATL